MKNLFLSLLLFIFTTPGVFSQEKELETEELPQESEEYYAMKFKKKRKTARILLGAGVGVMAVSVAITAATGGYGVVIGAPGALIGGLSALASIPFYVKARSYKKKAAEASTYLKVSIGTIRQPKGNNLALGLSYNF